jgi:hypothetical protein
MTYIWQSMTNINSNTEKLLDFKKSNPKKKEQVLNVLKELGNATPEQIHKFLRKKK